MRYSIRWAWYLASEKAAAHCRGILPVEAPDIDTAMEIGFDAACESVDPSDEFADDVIHLNIYEIIDGQAGKLLRSEIRDGSGSTVSRMTITEGQLITETFLDLA